MVEFRPVKKNDIAAVASLHAKSWQQNYRGTFSNRFLNDEVKEERLSVWQERIQNPQDNQFVQIAEMEGTLIGFICGYVDDHPKYGTLIDNLHVDSKFIGRRIGEKLMIEAANFLEKREKTSMYLWVLANNRKAIKFYERMGGKAMETINDFDIGDREITKTRYYWPSLKFILSLGIKESANEH